MYFTIPSKLNGYIITSIHISCVTVSSSGVISVQVHNVTDSVDILSTKATIDQSEYSSYTAAVAPVVDPDNKNLATGDRLRIDIDDAGVGAKGLDVIISTRPA